MKNCVVLGLTACLSAIIATPGCGRDEGARTASQVAAKVNAEEITVQQVNDILARTPNVTPESAGRMKREILDRMIDQKLAEQRAIDRNLDRSPAVVQSLEAARSEILARAYLEQVAAAQARPTAEEAEKYYAEHPELFANRRIFNLEEIVVVPADGTTDSLREQVAEARSLLEIAAWLKSLGAEFTTNRGVRAAEKIPLEMLPDLQAMKEGEIRVIEAVGRLYVFRVVAAREAPMTRETAMPLIQTYLSNKRSAEAVAREMKKIKRKANIVYVGEFARELKITDGKSAAGAETSPLAARPVAQSFDKGVRSLE